MRKKRILRKRAMGVALISASIVAATAAWNTSVFRIYGESMDPVFMKGDVVLSTFSRNYEQGDVIAFYHGEKLMVKRVTGVSGDWIDISEDGTVFINNRQLRETYLKKSVKGNCEIDFPYQVPKGTLFVMNDQRSDVMDSRNKIIGCIGEDEVAGKCVFRLWPLQRLGWVR